MAKYVNVDTVHKSLKSLCNKYKISFGSHYGGFGEEIAKLSYQLPVVDVTPIKHARWEISLDGYYPYCSKCNEEPKNGVMSNYCPNCGAKMDLEVK